MRPFAFFPCNMIADKKATGEGKNAFLGSLECMNIKIPGRLKKQTCTWKGLFYKNAFTLLSKRNLRLWSHKTFQLLLSNLSPESIISITLNLLILKIRSLPNYHINDSFRRFDVLETGLTLQIASKLGIKSTTIWLWTSRPTIS